MKGLWEILTMRTFSLLEVIFLIVLTNVIAAMIR